MLTTPEGKGSKGKRRRKSYAMYGLFVIIVVMVFSVSLFIVDLDDVEEGGEVHIQLESPTDHSSLQHPHTHSHGGHAGGGDPPPAGGGAGPADGEKGKSAGGWGRKMGAGAGAGAASKAAPSPAVQGVVVPKRARGRPTGTPYSLRFYIYDDVPASLNRNLRQLQECRMGYSASEVLVPELIASSDLYTRHGDLADFYVVPIMSECYLLQKLHQGMDFFKAVQSFNRIFSKVLDRIQSNYPYWMRTEGRDHIFMFPSERGVSILDSDNLVRVKKSIFVSGVTSRTAAHFSTWKDIVMPPAVYGLPSGAELDRDLGEEGGARAGGGSYRDILMHFRGHLPGEEDKNLGGLRAHLHATLSREEGVVFQGVSDKCGRNCTLAEMLRSKYCLVPGGEVEGWSMRLVHSIALGCVPVLVHDDVELPFEELVDWREFSLKVREGGVSDMLEQVRGTSSSAWSAKRAALEKVKRRFTYHDTWQEGDAFDSLLQVLSHKYRFFRNSPYRFWSDIQPHG